MSDKKIKKLLRHHHLRLTTPRRKILEVFCSFSRALKYNEILQAVEQGVDRVTVYRTLKAFEDAGLIHRVVGAIDVPVYALSSIEGQLSATDNAQYVHFSCILCHSVCCLDGVNMPGIELPNQFIVRSLNLTVIGICETCNSAMKEGLTQPDDVY